MEATEDPDDHFDRDRTELLLNLYLQNVHKFRNPKMKKKDLWIDIANIVGKSADSCDKKFRNLKMTYVRLVKKKMNNELTTCKWPFFDIFEEIYNVGGEYQPEIQQRIQETPDDKITKALLLNAGLKFDVPLQNGETSNGEKDLIKRRLLRKRNAEFRKATADLNNQQKAVEEKLDRLINIVQESNNIQRERNRLFQEFLNKLNPND